MPETSDRTTRAVLAQLQAMACELYELGVYDRVTGQMVLKEPRIREEVEASISWLKSQNAGTIDKVDGAIHKHDVFIRPVGSVGLILVDDLAVESIARMRRDGLAPTVIVETSPGNMQVWVRVSRTPIAENLATATARTLAERYDGDLNSADWHHFGRLAGFTNTKKEHKRWDNGLHPYVLLRECCGMYAEKGAKLLQEAQEHLHGTGRLSAAPTPSGPMVRPISGGHRTPKDAYLAVAQPLLARYGNTTDYSRLDWMVCRRLACTSLTVDQAYLEEAMLTGSPGMDERKIGHEDDYVQRTARKVLRDPQVIAAREILTQNTAAQRELGVSK